MTVQAIVNILAIKDGMPELVRIAITEVEKMVLKARSKRYRTMALGRFEDSLKVTVPFMMKLNAVEAMTAVMFEMTMPRLPRVNKA